VQPFLDLEIGLTGKPDYLVRQGGFTIPVEVKSKWAPPEPYESHIFQLAAYCLLIEKTSGTRPPYGILKYHNRSFAIDYTSQLKSEMLELLDEMRYKLNNNTLNRSHQQSARCARCGYRFICDQRL
jgi:CRISPR-associated exonuclease Cas4